MYAKQTNKWTKEMDWSPQWAGGSDKLGVLQWGRTWVVGGVGRQTGHCPRDNAEVSETLNSRAFLQSDISRWPGSMQGNLISIPSTSLDKEAMELNGVQAECYSTCNSQTQRQHTLLSPNSGGLQEGLELMDLLSPATTSTLGWQPHDTVGYTFIYSSSKTGWEAWLGIGRGTEGRLWSPLSGIWELETEMESSGGTVSLSVSHFTLLIHP